MKLLKRFLFFGTGLLIGSVFVYFIWEKKDVHFDYGPNARVLKNIRTDVQFFSDDAKESMITIGLDSVDIAMILQDGDVDFGESSPRAEPCKTYVINGNPKEKNITLIVKKCDTISTIDKVLLGD
ncbi:MAG: hypothetical protein COB73_04525 [Flavobacteriaceae bacterium]|nr:MAG: hypothetical protein COB73_04525 [Flavobacteriaceae bacterium]